MFYILVILIGIYGISLLFLYVVLNGICDCITLYTYYIVLNIIKMHLIFLRGNIIRPQKILKNWYEFSNKTP